MNKSGIVITVGIVLLCMGMKFNSMAMNKTSGNGLMTSSGLSAGDRASLNDQIKKLDAQIAQKEQELEKAGRIEEYALAKELNALRKKRADVAKMLTLDVILAQSELRGAIPAKQCKLRAKFIESLYFKPLLHGVGMVHASWSPDGSKVVTTGDSFAKIWDVATGTQTGAKFPHDSISLPVWSPDGNKLATCIHNKISIWNVAMGNKVVSLYLPDMRNRSINAMVWSPDGSKFAILAVGLLVAGDPGIVAIWNALTGVQISPNLYSAATIGTRSLAWSPDGSKIAAGGWNNFAKIWNCTTSWAQIGPDLDMQINSISWSPDGSKLATGSGTGAKIWDAANGTRLGPIFQHGVGILCVAWSPDGSKLATGSVADAKIWDISTGTQIGSNLQHNTAVNLVAWSPNGSKLATGSGTDAKIWDISTGTQIGSDLQHNSIVNSVAWNPDGSKLLTASSDGFARIWNVAVSIDNKIVQNFLANLNIDQCELLRALDMMVKREELKKPLMPIELTDDQWYTFITFPKAVQDVLRLYIKKPGAQAAPMLEESERYRMDERVGKAIEEMWEREEREAQQK